MHIGFEAKRFFSNFTGLGNYARFVISALSEHAPRNTYYLYSPKIKPHPEYDAILQRENIKTIGPAGLYRMAPSLWRSFGVSQGASLRALDIFHGLSQELPAGLPTRIRKVVTVHDLIFLRFPEYYNPIDVAIYKTKVKSACRRADRVIAISQQTASDLTTFLQIDPQKISVIYQGCHPTFSKVFDVNQRQAVLKKYELPDRYILNVGTIEPRKNVLLAVRALPLLEDKLVKLVIVGRATKYKEEILRAATSLNVLARIIFLHGVSFSDLPSIYQNASVFVYPSLFEGFGIPLVEAIVSRIPVISSTGSCFQEAAGPYSSYVDPSDAEALAKAMNKLLQDKQYRDSVTTNSAEYIKRFDPSTIAGDLGRVYADLL
jgi:glycosyltransferase involved in cell wall biosynthesis